MQQLAKDSTHNNWSQFLLAVVTVLTVSSIIVTFYNTMVLRNFVVVDDLDEAVAE